jgi:magnesium chelatase family protein
MSLCLVQGRALLGLQAVQVTVEVHLANGLPSFTLVGLADVEVVLDNKVLRSDNKSCGGRLSQ